jgi:hypothetical protein
MSGKRQKIQYSLALEPMDRGEAPNSGHEGIEPSVAKTTSESSASAEQLMEEVCDRETTHSVSPDSISLPKPNPIEPPWYVTRMPGGVGGVAPRGVPLSRSTALSPQRLNNFPCDPNTGSSPHLATAAVWLDTVMAHASRL